MRRTVLVRLSPVRATLYTVAEDGAIRNQFRYSLANRGHRAAAVVFSIRQLPGAALIIAQNPVAVQPGETVQGEFSIAERPAAGLHEVSHFTIVTTSIPERVVDSIPMTFLMPQRRSHE
jgi:hypothetical protein